MTPIGPFVLAVRTSLVLVVALTLQLGVAPTASLLGVQGDLLLLVAIASGVAVGADRGATLGFIAGLAYDLLLQTPLGLSALTYGLVAYLVGSMQDSVLRAAWWIPVATASVASVIGVILYGVFGTVVGDDLIGLSLVRIALVVGLLNTLAAPVVVKVMRWSTGTTESVRARAVMR
jgi:rod shape-determining protein MreD